MTLRTDRLFACLVAAHVLLKAACWPVMRDARLSGDEGGYRDSALALRNLAVDLVTLRGPDVLELKTNVVSNGWFMPGPAIVLAPLYLFVPGASAAVVRVYVGVLTTALLLATAIVLYRVLGRRYGLALLVFPGLVPMWVMFSYTAWGDTWAGLVIVLILAALVGLARSLAAGNTLRLRPALGFGVLAAVCLYLRSSAFPLVLGCLLLVLLGVLVLSRGRSRWRGLVMAVVATATFAALLAPWSVMASRTLDARVTTTTTLPLSLATSFGDVDQLCFGPCDQGSIWFTSVRYSREVGAITGTSEVHVQGEMADYALRDVEPNSYARAVWENADRFAGQPTAFLARFWPDRSPDNFAGRVIVAATWLLYLMGALGLVLAVLAVFRGPFDDQVVSLLTTLLAMACFLQPFVHSSHGRYWPVFAPLMGIGIALVAGRLLGKRPTAEPGVMSLLIGQGVAVATLVVGVGALAVLAA